jgi:hypothetical protein
LPTPGQEKIVSVRIAPAKSVPTCRPTVVTTGDERVAQGVDGDDAKPAGALGARRAHVVLAQHLEHRRSRHSRDDGERDRAERDRRQDEMRERASKRSPVGRRAASRPSMKPVTGAMSYWIASRPDTGVQPRPTENARMRSSPHQKIGIE